MSRRQRLASDPGSDMEDSTVSPPEGGAGSPDSTSEKEALSGLTGSDAAPEDTLQNGERAGGDLSPINAMMSAVMSAAGSINGAAEGSVPPSAGASPRPSPSKTPPSAQRAPPSRHPRRNQEAKEEGSAHVCPLCDKSCPNQHQLTMHIRQHNADTGNTDHSCSICGKCLSSASSLDRHMLVHSGERPYKCNICGQTFTTNGNMHRHMKIHEKDPASGLLPVSPPSPTKRRRPSVKRRQGLEEESGEEPPSKKVVEDFDADEVSSVVEVRGAEEELLQCPICFKNLSTRLDLDAHMDTHPDTALRCDLCCLSFRTHRGLLRHNAAVHKLLPQDPSGRPFIQSNPSIPTGFNDLAFIDFSCKKFAHIAQVWCETNLRRCISKFHRFVCHCCDKAFPLRSALDLHTSASHGEDQDAGAQRAEHESDQEQLLKALGLRHVSKVESGPTDEEIHQAHLDSIKVIHVDPPTSSLPQEPAAAFLPGGLGLTLATLSIPLLESSGSASSLQGLSQREALSLLSLQPFQAGFLLQQPDGGAATAGSASSGVKPGEAARGGLMELADIQQILKVATAAPTQMGLTLPPLARAPGFAGGHGPSQKVMPPLKPKPPSSPRSSLAATTPPPLQSSQQASLGCISPSLPPPAVFKTPPSSSATRPPDADADPQTPASQSPPAATTPVQEEGARKSRALPKGTFPCRFCDQVFNFAGVLQAHMRFHLGILPHQCNICDYVAPDKATLIRHLRTHSGERPYVCRVCHYPFTVKANCERHLRKKHGKTSRKEIEKNIKCVFSTPSLSSPAPADSEPAPADTACRFCGEDLKTYRALQIHLRTHNGCQRKPFECRRCGAAFLAKRNCIHHLLKHHPEVQEREIEEHIATLPPAAAAASPLVPKNGVGQVKVEEVFPAQLDQPLDFSAKKRLPAGPAVTPASPGVKLESESPTLDQPIDLSVPSKRQRREAPEIKTEPSGPLEEKLLGSVAPLGAALGCYHLPPAAALPATRPPRNLKPLLPKPTSASSPCAAAKELPPLASIAQIIHSVSGAPDLLKRDVSPAEGPGPSGDPAALSDDPDGACRKRGRKKPVGLKEKPSHVDLESSGEFASVEKMLATTDANKFSTYLQTGTGELPLKKGKTPAVPATPQAPDTQPLSHADGEEKPRAAKDEAKTLAPQSKGKKNAYSNSAQKMTCPFCPRVFPWASSLQRHMLTHTGQKPFPCPKCDAFFSTKSNCERHLLRKHGVTNRTLRRNGALAKKEGDEASPESAESQSETEQVPPEPQEEAEGGAAASPGSSHESASSQSAASEEKGKPNQQAAAESQEQDSEPVVSCKQGEHTDDDDCHSNNSLDLNFGKKLIDFKLSASSTSSQAEAAPPSVAQSAAVEEPDPAPEQSPPPQPGADDKHVCHVCKKSFRYATTLARHERAHLPEEAPRGPRLEEEEEEEEPEAEEEEEEEQKMEAEEDGSEDEREEKGEERSDGEVSEPKFAEGDAAGGRVDKRKKICHVCEKRFWSLQDLTRHMRSHTGERPYQCQTCDRTFTLKHSLVRHQRIHLKPRGDDGSEDGDSCVATPTSTCPPSENESEGGAAKDLEDDQELEGRSLCPQEAEPDLPKEPSPAAPAGDH
ncbi:ras-responsive element-binding protein 1 isoform 3-T3 [Synchiropus picturatus]